MESATESKLQRLKTLYRWNGAVKAHQSVRWLTELGKPRLEQGKSGAYRGCPPRPEVTAWGGWQHPSQMNDHHIQNPAYSQLKPPLLLTPGGILVYIGIAQSSTDSDIPAELLATPGEIVAVLSESHYWACGCIPSSHWDAWRKLHSWCHNGTSEAATVEKSGFRTSPCLNVLFLSRNQ